MIAGVQDEAVLAVFGSLGGLSPVMLRMFSAGLRLGGEASGRRFPENQLLLLAAAVDGYAWDCEAGNDGPNPLALILMAMALRAAGTDERFLERLDGVEEGFWRALADGAESARDGSVGELDRVDGGV